MSQAIAILRYLASHPSGAGVNAIARGVGISPSSCFNVVKTLARERFLDFDAETKAYTLGPGVIVVARRALDPGGAFPLIRADLESLADRFQATAALWRISRSRRAILLGFAESDATTRIHMAVGQRLPIFAGALGRTYAAHSGVESEELQQRLAEIQWASEPSLADYLADVAHARAHGWAIDENRFMRGVTNIAAPVVDHMGRMAFSVSATLFTGQHDPQRLREIGAATRAVAERLSARSFGGAVTG